MIKPNGQGRGEGIGMFFGWLFLAAIGIGFWYGVWVLASYLFHSLKG